MILLFSCVSIAQGTAWEKYPLKNLVEDNPLIIVGKVVRVQQISRKGAAFDIVYIRITRVLKNSLPKNAPRFAKEVPLWMPSTRDETMSTDDVRHPFDAEGIWFLRPTDGTDKRRPKGVFHTQDPDELQPQKLFRKVVKLIAKSTPHSTVEQTHAPFSR